MKIASAWLSAQQDVGVLLEKRAPDRAIRHRQFPKRKLLEVQARLSLPRFVCCLLGQRLLFLEFGLYQVASSGDGDVCLYGGVEGSKQSNSYRRILCI